MNVWWWTITIDISMYWFKCLLVQFFLFDPTKKKQCHIVGIQCKTKWKWEFWNKIPITMTNIVDNQPNDTLDLENRTNLALEAMIVSDYFQWATGKNGETKTKKNRLQLFGRQTDQRTANRNQIGSEWRKYVLKKGKGRGGGWLGNCFRSLYFRSIRNVFFFVGFLVILVI